VTPFVSCVLEFRVSLVFVVVMVVSEVGLHCIRFFEYVFIVSFLFVLISFILDMCLTDLIDI
jgi:hypothetical protein